MAEASVHGGIYSVFWKDQSASFFAPSYEPGRVPMIGPWAAIAVQSAVP